MLTYRSFSCILITTIAISGFAADIVIESRSEGKNHNGYSEPVGHWLDSNNPPITSKSAAPGLTSQSAAGSRKATVVPNTGAAPDAVLSSARFTPKIEAPGDYNVYITFPKAGNATPVSVLVKSAKGEETKEIAQDGWGATIDANSNKWIEIGKYPFGPTGDQYVELRVTGKTGAADPRNPVQAFADAVRFSTEPLPASKAAMAAPAGKTPAPVAKLPTGTTAMTKIGADTTAAGISNEPLKWAVDLAAGRAAGEKAGKKVFVYFYSNQSSRSIDYEKNVINDPKVKGVIAADFVPVKIDMDDQKELSTQLQVFRAGTINVYEAANGNGLEHISDAPDADDLVKRLNAIK